MSLRAIGDRVSIQIKRSVFTTCTRHAKEQPTRPIDGQRRLPASSVFPEAGSAPHPQLAPVCDAYGLQYLIEASHRHDAIRGEPRHLVRGTPRGERGRLERRHPYRPQSVALHSRQETKERVDFNYFEIRLTTGCEAKAQNQAREKLAVRNPPVANI